MGSDVWDPTQSPPWLAFDLQAGVRSLAPDQARPLARVREGTARLRHLRPDTEPTLVLRAGGEGDQSKETTASDDHGIIHP